MKDEGITADQIQNLCDVHAAVFEGSIEDIHKLEGYLEKEGHPAEVFLAENRMIEKVIADEIKPFLNKNDKTSILMLRIGYDRLSQIDNHYTSKKQKLVKLNLLISVLFIYVTVLSKYFRLMQSLFFF